MCVSNAVVIMDIKPEAVRIIGDSSRVCNSKNLCLRGLEEAKSLRIVSRILHEMRSLHERKERNNYLLSCIRQSFCGWSKKGYAIMNWTIGSPPYLQPKCCRNCFMHYYDIGNTTLTKLCRLVKQDKESQPSFTDHQRPYIYSEVFKCSLDDIAHRYGIVLNHRQVAAMQIPNSRKVLKMTYISVSMYMSVCLSICVSVCLSICFYFFNCFFNCLVEFIML